MTFILQLRKILTTEKAYSLGTITHFTLVIQESTSYQSGSSPQPMSLKEMWTTHSLPETFSKCDFTKIKCYLDPNLYLVSLQVKNTLTSESSQIQTNFLL